MGGRDSPLTLTMPTEVGLWLARWWLVGLLSILDLLGPLQQLLIEQIAHHRQPGKRLNDVLVEICKQLAGVGFRLTSSSHPISLVIQLSRR